MIGDKQSIAQKKIWQMKREIMKRIVAEQLHEYYNRLAKEVGWKINVECEGNFESLPKENKEVMLGMAEFVLKFRTAKDYEIINKDLEGGKK